MKKVIKFEVTPTDCSKALTAIPFDPLTIQYKNSGSEIEVAKTYTDLFIHTKKIDCPLEGCLLFDETCSNTFAFPEDISMSTIYRITVTELNPSGFLHKVCVSCVINPVGSTKPNIQTSNILEIKGLGPDCTKSLSDA